MKSMKFDIRARGVELDESLRSHVDRRLRFALTRFGRRLAHVHVLLQDVNGPRGGVDTLCKVRVELSPRGGIVIRDVSSDPFAAVSRAADRASRSIARHVGQLRDRWKGGRVSHDQVLEP